MLSYCLDDLMGEMWTAEVLLGRNFFVLKLFCSEAFLSWSFFWAEAFLSRSFFELKLFLIRSFFELKLFLSRSFFEPKLFWVEAFLSWSFFWAKTFLSWSLFEPKLFRLTCAWNTKYLKYPPTTTDIPLLQDTLESIDSLLTIFKGSARPGGVVGGGYIINLKKDTRHVLFCTNGFYSQVIDNLDKWN